MVSIATRLPPHDLLDALLQIERLHGRRRDVRHGPRTLDLDLLLYDDCEIADDRLQVPHPRAHLRSFVRAPLVEIAPKRVHPRLGLTVTQLLALLESDEHLRTCAGPEWAESDLVFTTRYGKPIDPDNFARSFHRLCARADLGHWTPHELRHSAASIMLAQGTSLWVVSEVLGHASIAMTKDTYGHLLGAEKQEATEAITDAWFEPDSGRREHQ